MLFGVGVLDSLLFTILIKALADQLPRFGERTGISAVLYVVIMGLFLLKGVVSSSWYMGNSALFYCGTPWAFHITFGVLQLISLSLLAKIFVIRLTLLLFFNTIADESVK